MSTPTRPSPPSPVVVATVNVNGIRAAVRRGMGEWLTSTAPDVLCLQEVRADDATLVALLEEALGDGWHLAHAEPTDAGTKGRAGVAVATRLPVGASRTGLPGFEGAGRWVELDVLPGEGGDAGAVTVVSAYVHSGEAGTPKQDDKDRFLAEVDARLAALAADDRRALVCGDLNIAHREVDLKNWKGNLTRAGFLPAERAHLDHWFDDLGWVDVVRAQHPETPGPYSWWSWRGQAFDNDTGWRIDYHLATPALARTASGARVDRAPSYAERFSDHAPVVVAYG